MLGLCCLVKFVISLGLAVYFNSSAPWKLPPTLAELMLPPALIWRIFLSLGDWACLKVLRRPGAWLIFSLNLGTDFCWKTCARSSAVGHYCHIPSLVIETCCLMQIRVCHQTPQSYIFLIFFSKVVLIHWSMSPRRLFPYYRQSSLTLFPTSIPSTLVDQCSLWTQGRSRTTWQNCQ